MGERWHSTDEETMNGNFPDEIISRLGEDDNHELLVNHAATVADRTTWLGQFSNEVHDGTPSEEAVARCLGWLHDFGKVAPAFQQYVRGEYPERKEQRYTYHARLGAFAVYYALDRMGAPERDRLAAWAAVLRHHGRLPDFAEKTLRVVNGEQEEERREDWAGPQLKQIQSHRPSRKVASTLLAKATEGTASWDSFADAFESGALFDDLLNAVAAEPTWAKATSEKLPANLYDRTTRFWSSLTFADKTAAGKVDANNLKPRALELDQLETYIQSLQHESGANEIDIDTEHFDPTDEASLNVLRETARQRVQMNATELVDAEVGMLTLPTGLGKTFTGITGAFELRDTLAARRERKTKPIVVYALPYTSIIEQTRDIFEDEHIFDADPQTNEFTVHHYLADTVTYTDTEVQEDGTAETDAHHSKAELLGESWRSGVVLTTFVQLFESLAGPTNAQGLKLPALQDAVVVLDEPQALPIRWWDGIRRLVRLLLDEYDTRIISMTATQPTLFTEGDFDTQSLLKSDERNPDGEQTDEDLKASTSFERQVSEAVARVQYNVHNSVRAATPQDQGAPISHADAAVNIVSATQTTSDESTDGRSVLAVCNTIGSSRRLTEYIEDEFLSKGRSPIHLGAVYESVLSELDTDVDKLPDHKVLADQLLSELGFEYDTVDDSLRPRSKVAERAYVGTFNSRYRPLDRRVLIRVAERLSTADVPFVFISTQAIEAGVDISFAQAYRDIAPLDSVVQTAGRCNRSFEWGPENGEVTVWMLDAIEDEDSDDDSRDSSNRKPPSKYVYDGNLLRDAAKIILDLRDGGTATISSVALEHDAVPRYFDAIESKSLANETLVEEINESAAEALGRRSLIGKSYETVDLIVAVTDTDRQRIDRLGDAFERHASEGFKHLSELADLRVSIPVRDLEKRLPNHVRADRSERTNADGVDVFVHRGNEGYGAYNLAGGGFVSDDDSGPSGRFTL